MTKRRPPADGRGDMSVPVLGCGRSKETDIVGAYMYFMRFGVKPAIV